MSDIHYILIFLFPLLLLIGLPIYAVLGIIGLVLSVMTDAPLVFASQNILNGLDKFALLAIPAFILAGKIMEKGGITNDIIRIFRQAFGHIPGSLGLVTIFSCMFFAAISGSGPGTVAAVGAIMIPAMIKDGYPKRYAASVSATGGTLGVMIPPSNPLIIYGIIANVSISDLFAAGLLPGIMTAILLAITAYLLARASGAVLKADDTHTGIGVLHLIWGAKFALFLPIFVLGGIYSGFFTPVEASVCAVVYALVVAVLVYRQLTWQRFLEAVDGTLKMSGALMIIIACSTLFATVITLERIPQTVVETFGGITDSPVILLFLICALLIVIGTFMETMSAIIILAPILVPLVKSYGIDPVHFGIILIVTIEIAFLTPPLGVNLFVASQIAKLKFEKIVGAIMPYVFTLIIAMSLVILIPQISLWLPQILRTFR